MTSYPNTCSQVTASFAVLSETIKEIQSILKEKKRSRNDDLVSMIQQLQNLERLVGSYSGALFAVMIKSQWFLNLQNFTDPVT